MLSSVLFNPVISIVLNPIHLWTPINHLVEISVIYRSPYSSFFRRILIIAFLFALTRVPFFLPGFKRTNFVYVFFRILEKKKRSIDIYSCIFRWQVILYVNGVIKYPLLFNTVRNIVFVINVKSNDEHVNRRVLAVGMTTERIY